ncbi:glycosyltransferase family A protein [Hafnia alvei]|uniref:Putative glycosyltransferase EpsJ n=1 Tax=Hafnia alvei TaxID=569 RepID=A0A172X048_HAFAL|nr:glycosyltransferase family A protein [Hafnia alvei]ANF29982.1 putative glycosyltransferase EpsJ [Hafnia alvei]TBL63614.1 glycosyltransferase family 2 protein [Hafnia alvei]
MDKYVLTVIITAYNRAELCLRSLKSVPKLDNIEIIIVDDGSIDNLGELISPLLSDRIKYFYKDNGGAASAKNFGAKKSSGKYILFLDSDDYFSSESAFRNIVDLCKNSTVDFLYSESITVLKNGKVETEETPFKLSKGNIYEYVLASPLNYPGKPSYVFRRLSFLNVSGFDEKTKWGDAVLFWRLFLSNATYQPIKVTNYVYDQSSENSVSRGNHSAEHFSEILDTIYRSYISIESILKLKGYAYNWLIIILALSIKSKKYRMIINIILKLAASPISSFKAVLYILRRRFHRG